MSTTTALSKPESSDTCKITIIEFIYEFALVTLLNKSSECISCISPYESTLSRSIRCVMVTLVSFLIRTSLLLPTATLIVSSSTMTAAVA